MKNIYKLFLGIIFAIVSSPILAMQHLNLPQGVTPISHEIYDLHMTVFYICCVIGLLVFGVLIYSLVKFRHSKGAVAQDFHENLVLEIIWATIPFVILVLMAIPATKVLVDIHDTSKSALTVKITGYQWKWQYEYLDEDIKFFSNLSTPNDQINGDAKKDKWFLLEVDHPLVLPIHEKIRFLMTSNDVIHSWWVPDLAVKQDAIPGYINDEWAYIEKPGVYRGQCAELCGVHHGFMPIVVHAVTKIEFQDWMKKQKQAKTEQTKSSDKTFTKDELMTNGKQAYATYCAACHKSDGNGMPPAFPALKGSAIAVGPVSKHIDIVVNGVKNTAMQAFGGQLDNTTLAAIITYERNAWGNDTSKAKVKVVQPKDIAKAKK